MGKTIVASPNKRQTTLTQREVTGSNHGSKFPIDTLPLNPRNEKFTAVQTALNASTATQVVFPVDAVQVRIKNISTSGAVIWLGAESTISAGGAGTYPLEAGDEIIESIRKGFEVELWAIASTGTPSIYTIGGHRDV